MDEQRLDADFSGYILDSHTPLFDTVSTTDTTPDIPDIILPEIDDIPTISNLLNTSDSDSEGYTSSATSHSGISSPVIIHPHQLYNYHYIDYTTYDYPSANQKLKSFLISSHLSRAMNTLGTPKTWSNLSDYRANEIVWTTFNDELWPCKIISKADDFEFIRRDVTPTWFDIIKDVYLNDQLLGGAGYKLLVLTQSEYIYRSAKDILPFAMNTVPDCKEIEYNLALLQALDSACTFSVLDDDIDELTSPRKRKHEDEAQEVNKKPKSDESSELEVTETPKLERELKKIRYGCEVLEIGDLVRLVDWFKSFLDEDFDDDASVTPAPSVSSASQLSERDQDFDFETNGEIRDDIENQVSTEEIASEGTVVNEQSVGPTITNESFSSDSESDEEYVDLPPPPPPSAPANRKYSTTDTFLQITNLTYIRSPAYNKPSFQNLLLHRTKRILKLNRVKVSGVLYYRGLNETWIAGSEIDVDLIHVSGRYYPQFPHSHEIKKLEAKPSLFNEERVGVVIDVLGFDGYSERVEGIVSRIARVSVVGELA